MASRYWLKLYHEMLDDPKIGQLPPVLRWRFVECLLVAGETDENGFLPDVAQMAWRVRENVERYETELNELAKAGLLSKVDGRYLVTNFNKRQDPVSGAERVARYRERQKKQEYYEPETEAERDGNDSVTKRYTDTDIDTEKNREECGFLRFMPEWIATPPVLNEWGEWLQYNEDNGRPLTERTAKAQLKEMGDWGEQKAIEAIQTSIKNGWRGLFEPKSSAGEAKEKGDYRLLWSQVKAEMSKNGRRSTRQWNGQIAPVLKKSGGYLRLCSLTLFEAEQTFKSAFQDMT